MGLNHTHGIIILAFCISLTVAANVTSQLYVPCKPGWYFFGRQCYKLLSSGRDTELPAFSEPYLKYLPESLCYKYRGHLASIHSNELQEFLTVFLLLNSMEPAKIGLRYFGNRIQWDDRSIYNYTNWESIEPLYKDNKPYCIVMLSRNFKDRIGKWSKRQCTTSTPAICQVNLNLDDRIRNSTDPRFCPLEVGGGWKYQSSCYHIVKEEKSWEDAENYCEEKYGGYLASILDNNTDLFLNYIHRMSNLSTNVWIGIKIRNNSPQKWISGWHVANKTWNQDLLQFGNGTCVMKSNRSSLAVAPCLNKYPFICEKITDDNVPVLKKPPSDDWKCPDSSKKWLDLDGEFCYYIETENLEMWLAANYHCGRMGGTLASFHSEEETKILHPHVLNTQEKLFIGIRRIRNGINYVHEWADGTDVIYEHWNYSEHYLHSRRRELLNSGCGELSTETMEWSIVPCNIHEGYICKSKKVLSKMDGIFTTVPCNSSISKDQSLSVSENETFPLYVPCKPGWYLFGEKCYKLLGTGSDPKLNLLRLDWAESKSSCAKYGGHLASINSNELQEFLTVFLLLNLKTGVWLGLQDLRRINKTYSSWDDGSMYNYTNWDRDEPSSKGSELHCAAILFKNFKDRTGKWSAEICKRKFSYICQVNKSDSENSPDPRFCSLEEGGGWKYLNSCYHIVKEEKTWEDAEQFCEEKYRGYLVSILDDNSDLFLSYIQRLSKLSKNVWIGIKMRNNSMQKWTSGWHVASRTWNQELLQFVNGTCALKSNLNSWAVSPCHNKYPFICEKMKYNVPVLKTPPSDDWKCPNSSMKWFDLEGEFCYYIETEKSRNWIEANEDCRRIGGTLASFHSEEETNILHPHVLDTKEVLWIGLKRSPENNNVFKWADGTDVVYQNWNWHDPRSMFKNDCADLWTGTMKWHVVPCNISQGYICKSEKVFLEIEEISTPVTGSCAVSNCQTSSGGIPVGTVIVIVFSTLLVVLLVVFIVYHSRNFWKRYFVKTENDGLSTAPAFSSHVSEKVIWRPLR